MLKVLDRHRTFCVRFSRGLAAIFLAALAISQSGHAQEVGPPAALDNVGPKLPISSYNGSYSYNVPIDVPAFHGIEPKLSISYDSSRGIRSRPGAGGWLGVGWALEGVSVIERVSGNGLAIDASGGRGTGAYGLAGMPADRFTLDGDELEPCTATDGPCTNAGLGANQLRYRGRVETFLRIRYDQSTNDWFVHGRDGTRYEYLGPAETNTFRWYLSRVVDRKGNFADYTYSCTAGQECVLSSITLNNQGTSGSPVVTINFHYEARPETLSIATGQGFLTNPVRLKTIRILMGTSLMRAYRLAYDVGSATSLSRLLYVQQYGRDATFDGSWTVTGGSALPATQFTYSELSFATGWSDATWANYPPDEIMNASGPAIDVNGDGYADTPTPWLRMLTTGQNANGNCTYSTQTAWSGATLMSTGTGFSEDSQRFGPQIWDSQGMSCTPPPYPPHQPEVKYRGYADFTGDGGIDMLEVQLLAEATALITSHGIPRSNWATDDNDKFDGGIANHGDFDGDGKADIVTKGQHVWLSTGTSFVMTTTWNVPALNGTTVDTADLNGDGKADMVLGKKTPVGGTNYWQITPYLSTGAQFVARTPLNLSTDTGGDHTSILLGDVNGDGRSDLIRVYDYDSEPGFTGNVYGVTVYLSNGSTFVAGAPEQKFGGFIESTNQEARLADINGDGRIDLLLSHESDGTSDSYQGVDYQGKRNRFRLYLSNGAGFSATAYQFDDWIAQVGDYNGDGRVDFALHAPTASNVRLSTGGVPPDLLTGVVEPLGGKIAIAYESSAGKPDQKLQFVLPVVKSITLDDGRGGSGAPVWSSQTTFDYTAGLWSAAERQFFGFLTVSAQLPAIQGETTGPKQVTTFVQSLACLGKASLIESFNGAGTLLRSVENVYTTSGGSGSAYTCHNTRTTTNDILSGQTKSTRVERTFDNYGNQLTLKTIGELTANTDDRFDQSAFYNDPADYIVGCPRREEAYFGLSAVAANLLTRTDYVLEGYVPASGDSSVTSCLVTSTKKWISNTQADAEAFATYDNVGNVLTETDEVGGVTQYIYDATKLFVIEKRLPKYSGTGADTRFKELTQWLSACAKPSQTTDINSQNTTYDYDALCRPKATLRPGGDYDLYQYVNLPLADASSPGGVAAESGDHAAPSGAARGHRQRELDDGVASLHHRQPDLDKSDAGRLRPGPPRERQRTGRGLHRSFRPDPDSLRVQRARLRAPQIGALLHRNGDGAV